MKYFKNHSGYSLTEIMIAAGIIGIVSLAGMRAFQYFNKETKKELSKMDNLAEFNLLAQDFLKFAESAGISTAYLNLPVKTSGCSATEPCVRKLVNNTLVNPKAGEVPQAITQNACIQFYWDGKGSLDYQLAYPEKPNRKDEIVNIENLNLSSFQNNADIVASWTLKDEKSPPFMLLKLREKQVILKYLRGSKFEISRSSNTNNLRHAFFESDESPETVGQLKGFPFLIYNSILNNHFTIQYAKDIIPCKERASECKTLLGKISQTPATDVELSANSNSKFPDKVFAIHFENINFDKSPFREIKNNYSVPAKCLGSGWGQGKQSPGDYLFPSKAFSVAEPDSSTSDLGGIDPVNVLHLSHYYTGVNLSQDLKKGLMVALPIDIVSYKIKKTKDSKQLQLLTDQWHATENKEKVRISNLKGPLFITRKLGSPEIGLWYNPLKKKGGTK